MSISTTAACFLALVLPAAAQCFAPEMLLPPDGEAFDTYGYDIVAEAGFLFVGAPREGTGGVEAGAVYVYEHDAAGWTFRQKLLASDASPDRSFGFALAAESDRLIVGAPSFYPWTSTPHPGAVYVFASVGGVWTETDKLVPSDAAADDHFGYDVALSGSTVLASSLLDDDVALNSGSVYAFDFQGPGWSETQKFTASDADKSDRFGTALAIDGDRAVVTSIWAGPADDGLAYVFERAGGLWGEVTKFSSNPPYDEDQFGMSVALQGSTILVGMPSYEATPVYNHQGAVFVYEESGGSWFKTQEITPDPLINKSYFGSAIDLEGDYALIGAGAKWSGLTDPGYAYLFERTDAGFQERDMYQDATGQSRDHFGGSVSIDGPLVCMSAFWDDEQGEDSGSVWVYSHTPGIKTFCLCTSGVPCEGLENNDPEAGCANSTGLGGRLTGCGSASVTANDLILTGSQLPPTQFAMLFMGPTTTLAPLGGGLRCVGGGLLRFPTQLISPAGFVDYGPIVSLSQSSFGPNGIQAGDRWYFQLWYRDNASPCYNSNLTSAVNILFSL